MPKKARSHVIFFLLLILLVLAIVAYGPLSTIIIRVFSLGIYKRGLRDKGICLTFDDGPHPVYTPQLLDLLKKYEIKAVFFVVGELAKRYPALVRRMRDEGHEIGIHHYRHVSSWMLLPHQLKKEIQECSKIIEIITNKEPLYYRPPWGHFNLFTLLLSRGYKKILWSSISGDWKIQKENDLIKRITASASDGTIILLHDNGDTKGADPEAPAVMLKALNQSIPLLKQQGLRFLPLNSLINGNKGTAGIKNEH
ncbi:polysaccharide deacetylase family protein [Bacillus sp. OV322]|uniref:polysaccharide deacetylase family protein n=1 Tax=Bacillus sp. OV322 TaxID=1882764 RepID=UPI00210E64F7|nr:polysaccharide deacetylase family protein [Bacillus sp. OV322]